MLVFATLGPEGTNHERVTESYIRFHGIQNASVKLLPDFQGAKAGLLGGKYDFIVQCAVHPSTPETMGSNFHDMFAADCFISRSKELAVLTRKAVNHPRSIGLLAPATESYIDCSRWERRVYGQSLPLIFQGLLRGEYDSALVYLEYADQYPDVVQVDQVIGSPDDVWIVYAREQTSGGRLLAWKESPITKLFNEKGAIIINQD
jgi:hypothetical protein